MKSLKSNILRISFFLFATLIFTGVVTAGTNATFDSKNSKAPEVEKIEGNLVSEEGAWCWFADSRALHYQNELGTINNSYIGYIDVHGNIKATQHNFITGVTSEVLIRSYFQPDDHDNPSFLVLPDERIMIFYSRHTDEACFYYRISKKPGDITSLGDEIKIITSANTTYPSPFILSDDPTHFYLTWRGINWHPTIARITIPDENDQVTVDWGPYQMVQSTGARPYCKYASNGKDKIFMSYTTGHPDNEYPNYLYYNYIDINSKQLKDVNGTVLKTISSGPLSVNKTTFPASYPNAVVDMPTNQRDWVWQTTNDTDGKPVVAMVQINYDKNTHNYYYAKWTGTQWRKTFLANGGGHFHQTPGLELCYSGGMAIDDSAPNVVYCSVPVTGTSGTVYEIMKYTIDNEGAVASTEQITINSTLNNVRPYIVTNSGNSPLKLVWMHGNYYDWIVSSTRPQGYPTSIHSDYALTTESIDLTNGLILNEEFDGTVTGTATVKSGVLVSSKDTYATLSVSDDTTFSISLSPYFYDGAYEGDVLTMGTIKFGLNGVSQKPYVAVGEDVYNSTNLFGTSDVWQTTNRGTGGQWYTPTKHKFFNLTLNYNGNELIVFRNGIIDQVIEIKGLTLTDVTLGGFNGWVEDCNIYNRVLTQEEIKILTKKSLNYTLDNSLLTEIELASLEVPSDIYTDVVLPAKSNSGNSITWVSGTTSVLSNTGLVNHPQTSTAIELTATINGVSKSFTTTVWPRNINNNIRFKYTFDADDDYTNEGVRYVQDKSGNEKDARIMGSALINGKLDLTANTAGGFSTNGYAIAPEGTLNNLRSFSFLARITPLALSKAPRIFDFGSASTNSILLRASAFTAGYKYNGNSTILINSSQSLVVGSENKVAMTFDAKTKTTKIYLNGVETASSTAIVYEPYQLTIIGADKRNYIGRTQWWDTSVAADNIDVQGTMDDLFLYDIALTADEITALQSDGTSAIKNVEKSFCSIYPNPTFRNDKILINCECMAGEMNDLRVEVTNLSGEIIQFDYPKSLPFELNGIEDSGVYIVHLTAGKRSLIKQKLVVI
ncbi:MAG: BNR-4 repeat-containing protein [Marinilabiliaceae bacterium]|nr:BNR-4 repeat-containing protein [Marinilabiliaceae bacterium]